MSEALSHEDLDKADMHRLVEGHDTALNQLMDRHGPRLFNFLIRSLQSESDADDLAQETFVRVYQNRTKFNREKSFSTWIYAIASNLVKDRYRYRSRYPQVSLDAENQATGNRLKETLPEEKPTPSETLESAERAEIIRRAVNALPEDLRIPLIVAEYEQCSQAQIGEILQCTSKAVETRIYRARRQLRESLAELL